MTHLRSLLILAISSLLAVGQPCTGSGLVLERFGERLDAPWQVDLFGFPGDPGLLGLDVDPGPVTSVFGLVCLGLTPSYVALPFTLDATGSTSFAGVLPPLPVSSTFDLSLQAATLPSAGGLTLSNGVTSRIRSPGLHVACAATGGGGMTFFVDGLTEDVRWTASLSAPPRDIVRLPVLGAVAVLQDDDSIDVFDERTGAPLASYSVDLGQPLAEAARIVPDETGANLLVFDDESANFALTPFTTRLVDALSGATLSTVTVPATVLFGAAPGYNPQLLAIPGTSIVWAKGSSRLWAADHATGQIIANFTSPTPLDMAFIDGRVVVLYGNNRLFTFNPTSGVIVSQRTLNSLWVPFRLRYGPGSNGPGLWIVYKDGSYFRGFVELDPTTLATRQVRNTGNWQPYTMEASPGGAEWMVIEYAPVPGTTSSLTAGLRRLDPVTATTTNVTALPVTTRRAIFPVNASTLRRAWIHFTSGTMAPIATDPLTTLGTYITIPGADLTTFAVTGNE